MKFTTLAWALVAILMAGITIATPVETSQVSSSVIPASLTAVPSLTSLANPYPTAEGGALVDVSYVTGYTVPIECYCGDKSHRLTGCSKALFELNKCPSGDFEAAKGSCHNPHWDGPQNAIPFFLPCAGKAYSFPKDHDSLANAKCQQNTVLCVVYPDNDLD